MEKGKKEVGIVGPILCNSGIATVVNAILSNEKLQEDYELIIFNSSNYKDKKILSNLICFVRTVRTYLMKLIRGDINLAHIHSSYDYSFYRKSIFLFFSFLFRVKTILHIHASQFDEFFINSKGVKSRIIGYWLKKSDVVVVLCKEWKDKLLKKYALKNVIVINNPAPLDMDEINNTRIEKSDSEVTKIVFLGFLIKTKGIYDIIEIAKRLNGNGLKYKISICGKGDEETPFFKKIREENLDTIEYLGWLSGEEKMDVFRESDLFLLPSYKEGMPMVILEAMSFGLPIISTKIAGIPELVKDEENGYLLAPGDIEGFVNKIKTLIQDPDKRKSFGQKGKLLVQNFNKNKIAEDWHRLYKNVLS